MAKFFVLYMAPLSEIGKWMKDTKPEDMKKGMEEWATWMKDNKKNIANIGAPLGKTKRVTSSGVSDAKNEVTGYSIVEADSHDAATKLFEGHPHFQIPGGYIDVLSITHMPS